MQERLYLINLYDYYGELLTDKQKIYFEEYYFNNLSLSEISEIYDISRNAIHKQLKEVENKLIYYEKILQLNAKKEKIEKILEKLNDLEIKKEIEEIKELI